MFSNSTCSHMCMYCTCKYSNLIVIANTVHESLPLPHPPPPAAAAVAGGGDASEAALCCCHAPARGAHAQDEADASARLVGGCEGVRGGLVRGEGVRV